MREELIQGLLDFLNASPTPFHATTSLAMRLEAAGYRHLDERATWHTEAGGRYYVTRNDSSIIAFKLGKRPAVDGGIRLVGAHTDSPCLRVKPNPELQRQGFFQLGVEVYGGALLAEQLAMEHDFNPDAVLDYELSFYDTQSAAIVGLNQDFIASARLDNLLSCYAGLQALIDADDEETCVLVCTDHEEVGSCSACGADGPFLEQVLRRVLPDGDAFVRTIQRSLLVSADNAHGVHPNYADKHDGNHGPKLNAGPVIKINSNQRYATNSETAGFFRHLCLENEVPVQSFVVRSDMACGSTIGPITASQLGVRTVDIGLPTFAMHSIRELAGSHDLEHLVKVLTAFYSSPELP